MDKQCSVAEENDILKQKISALCKERDDLNKTIDKLVVKSGDETIKFNAAYEDLKLLGHCAVCKNLGKCTPEYCMGWEWRGVQG